MRFRYIIPMLLFSVVGCVDGGDVSDSAIEIDRGTLTDGPIVSNPAPTAPVIQPPAPDTPTSPGTPQTPATGRCAALPAPTGNVIRVTPAQASSLPSIVSNAPSGSTILLEDGTYSVYSSLVFNKERVSLRSASGNPASVILDNGYNNDFLLVYAPDVTIAEITLKRSKYHLIHVTGNAQRAVLYRLKLIDAREQFVKVNANSGKTEYPDSGLLACSEAILTPAGRPNVNPYGTGCYTGGIDAHGAAYWSVRDNRFQDIYCTNGGLAEHAIHFWKGNRDTIVERNTIINCARGVGFGLGEIPVTRSYSDQPELGAPYPSRIGHFGGIIRNNMIFGNIGSKFDTGIELQQARGAVVYHNTIFSTGGSFSSIDSRFINTNPIIKNNLVFPATTIRNSATPASSGNMTAASEHFVNVAESDLHLAPNASPIGRGISLEEVNEDFDGNARNASAPDVGADEAL